MSEDEGPPYICCSGGNAADVEEPDEMLKPCGSKKILFNVDKIS